MGKMEWDQQVVFNPGGQGIAVRTMDEIGLFPRISGELVPRIM